MSENIHLIGRTKESIKRHSPAFLLSIIGGIVSGYLVFWLTMQPDIEVVNSKHFSLNETHDYYSITIKNLGFKDAEIETVNLTTYGYEAEEVFFSSTLESNIVEPKKLDKYTSFNNNTFYAISNFHLSPSEELELNMIFQKNITIEPKGPTEISTGNQISMRGFIIMPHPAIESLTILIKNEYFGKALIFCDSELNCKKRSI